VRDTGFLPVISVSGVTVFTVGAQTQPVSLQGALPALTLSGATPAEQQARKAALLEVLGQGAGHLQVTRAGGAFSSAIAQVEALREALGSGGVVTAFPNTTVGNALRQVANIIRARAALGVSRQIFFVNFGGSFDHHGGLLSSQAPMLTQLSAALQAFYNATVELGVTNDVTTFTLSDFARTFTPNGSAGTDHGWASHQLVMGGAVRGGDVYGRYPDLTPGGADDVDGSTGRGRYIPTTGVQQYGATLAKWYGVRDVDMPGVFPNIEQFPTADLGFMRTKN